jgi:hypothetical protein
MNKKTTMFLSIFFIVAVILSLTSLVNAGTPTEPHAGNAMWFEPIDIDLRPQPIGYTFNVTVWLNITSIAAPDDAVAGWQFCIVYEKAYLHAFKCKYSEGTISQFFEDLSGNTISVPATVGASFNTTHEYVLFSEGTYFQAPWGTVPRIGSLAIITFNVTGKPATELSGLISVQTTGIKKCSVYAWDIEAAAKHEITSTVTFYPTTYIIPEMPSLALIFAITSSTLVIVTLKKLKKPFIKS